MLVLEMRGCPCLLSGELESSLVLSGFSSHREKQEQIAVFYSFTHSFVHFSVICLSVLQFPAQLSRHP